MFQTLNSCHGTLYRIAFSFKSGEKLVPGAREVLTEIFKSCVHSEQMLSLTPAKPIKVADIYLSKEQINSQTPGNLLHVFFTNVRPPKKVLEDQLTQVVLWKLFSASFCVTWRHWVIIHFLCWKILRKYGVPKPKFDKSKYNKAGKEQHPVKVVSTKRPVTKQPTKEKSMLNSVRLVSSAFWRLWNILFLFRNLFLFPHPLYFHVLIGRGRCDFEVIKEFLGFLNRRKKTFHPNIHFVS